MPWTPIATPDGGESAERFWPTTSEFLEGLWRLIYGRCNRKGEVLLNQRGLAAELDLSKSRLNELVGHLQNAGALTEVRKIGREKLYKVAEPPIIKGRI